MELCRQPAGESQNDRQNCHNRMRPTENGYVLIEESRKSFLVSMIVELTAIEAIGDHQHDLSAATTN